MGRVLKLAAATALVLAGLVLLGWIGYSRAAFGTWDPMAQPNRIDYCDRRYLPGWHVTAAQIDSRGNDLGVYPLRQVGKAPNGVAILAKPLPDSIRHMYPNARPLPCAMTVYLKVGSDDYIAYGISGGP
jgi:hypothetical protein